MPDRRPGGSLRPRQPLPLVRRCHGPLVGVRSAPLLRAVHSSLWQGIRSAWEGRLEFSTAVVARAATARECGDVLRVKTDDNGEWPAKRHGGRNPPASVLPHRGTAEGTRGAVLRLSLHDRRSAPGAQSPATSSDTLRRPAIGGPGGLRGARPFAAGPFRPADADLRWCGGERPQAKRRSTVGLLAAPGVEARQLVSARGWEPKGVGRHRPPKRSTARRMLLGES